MSDRTVPPGVTMGNKQFATAINCVDGRVQIPVIEYMTGAYGVDYVDMITEAGPVCPLSKSRKNNITQSIRKRVELSVLKHRSQLIALVAHYDCAGNPVGKETQIQQMRLAVRNVAAWNLGIQVIGLWVDENWRVNEVGWE